MGYKKKEKRGCMLGEPDTTAYSVAGQKNIRRVVKKDASGAPRIESDEIFCLYRAYRAGDASVYETLMEKLGAWYRRHNTPEAVMEGISVSEKQILDGDVLTAEEAAEETRRIFGWQR